MKKIVPILWLLAVSIFAWANSIEILPRRQTAIESEPREKITVVFQITNNSQEKTTLTSTLDLPEGWKMLIQDTPLVLDPNQNDIKMLSFFIPQEAEAGLYRVGCTVQDKENEDLSGSYTFDVKVLPSIRVELKVKNAPPYVIAGDEFDAVFLILNKSNTGLDLELDITSAYDFTYELFNFTAEELHLDIGESREITVRVKTREEFSRIFRYRLGIQANPGTHAAAGTLKEFKTPVRSFCDLEIIPRVSREKFLLHTIPVEIILNHSQKIGETWQGEVKAEISGNGTLDEAGKNHVDFQIRKILNLPVTSFYNAGDRYSLKYWSDSVDLTLGDHGYSVSPLVENYRFGRGVMGRVNLHQLSFGGFYHYTPYTAPVNHYMAGFLDFYLPDSLYPDGYRYKVNINGFSRITDNLIFGLYQEFRPFREMNLELEIAAGSSFENIICWSGMFKGHLEHTWMDYGLNLIIAQPDFPGSYTDRYYLSSDIVFRLYDNTWKINSGYMQEQRNLQLNEGLHTAPLIRDFRLGTGYLWKKYMTDMSFLWKLKSRVDRLIDPGFDELGNTFELNLLQPFFLFNLHALAMWEILHSRLTSDYVFKQQHTTSISCAPNEVSTYNLLLGFDGYRSEYDITGRFSLGCGMSHQFEKAHWKLNLTGNFFRRNKVYGGSDLNMASGFGYQFNERNELSADAQFTLPQKSSGSGPEFRFSVEYKAKSDVPVGRKKDVGAIKGKIYDKRTDLPLENIIVRIADRAVTTNRKGRFSFSSLPPGEYFLEIDASRAGLHLIPDMKTPIMVSVKSRDTIDIEIGIVKSAVLEGSVTLYVVPEKRNGTLQNGGEKGGEEYKEKELVIDSGYPGVLIELKSEDETKRRLSDNKGFFIFHDIRPGLWTLTVYRNSLPRYHYFKQDKFILDLRPGGHEKADIKIFPKRRPLIIVQEGGLLTVTKETEKEAVRDEDDLSVILTDEEYARFTDTIERILLSGSDNTPRLFKLDWGISFNKVQEMLLEKDQGFRELSHISKLRFLDSKSVGNNEKYELENSAVIIYFSSGIAHYDLKAKVILSFYNPAKNKEYLYLSKVETQLSVEDKYGNPVNIENIFKELLYLFLSKWSIELDTDEENNIDEVLEYNTMIEDIDISYKLNTSDKTIVISYENNSIKRLISKMSHSYID